MKQPFEHYITKGYAGLIGKVIGVRLGAPVEGWSSERIAEDFGEPDGYLHDYKNFASDDDLNGPLFFYRALLDYGLDADAEAMGKTLLNYVPHGHGFFWWGGYGISTEHTAYTNLRAGISAPFSGSIEQNGPVAAEQIGGQIFSDCWGLLCPGDPSKAAEYARRASSVTHDGEGIYGGMFVAACIAAAFHAKTVDEVIESGLSQIPADSLYTQVTRDIMAFHKAHPEDWHECLKYIQENWGYDRFPGIVHIIPNAAVMILALLYGHGEFGLTLRICNFCGWDTDCNVGNLGTIMGVLLGFEGIESIWLEPLCDFVAASSSMGYLNIIDLANTSLSLSKLAADIDGTTLPERFLPYTDPAVPVCHFELPKSVHGFRVEGQFSSKPENSDDCAYRGIRSLKLSGSGTGRVRLLHRTYYVPSDFDDSRYDPSFSPTVYPGALCSAYVRSYSDTVSVKMAAWGRGGEELCSGKFVEIGTEWSELRLDLSAVDRNETIFGVGLVIDCLNGRDITLYLDDFTMTPDADYTIDFSREYTEDWNPAHKEIAQLTRLGGIWQLLDGALWGSGAEYCHAYTGHYCWSDYTVTSRVALGRGEAFRLHGRVQGGERSYAATLCDGELRLEKQDGDFISLASAAFAYVPGETVELSITLDGGKISAAAGGVCISAVDENPYTHGCIGWSVVKGRLKVENAQVKTNFISERKI